MKNKVQKSWPKLKRWLKLQLVKARKHPVRFALFALLVLVVLHFIFVGIFMFIYRDKTMPNLSVGSVKVGSIQVADANAALANKLAFTKVAMKVGDQEISTSAGELGLHVDTQKLEAILKARGFEQWLAPWLFSQKYDLPINYDVETSRGLIAQFKQPDFKQPKDAAFAFVGDELVITDHEDGLGVDAEVAMSKILTEVSSNLSDIELSLETSNLTAQITSQDIFNNEAQIVSAASTKYEYVSAGKTVALTKPEVASLLTLRKSSDGQIAVVANKTAADELIKNIAAAEGIKPVNKVTNKYLSGKKDTVATEGVVGRKVTNIENLANELIAKLDAHEPLQMILEFSELPFETEIVEIDDVTVRATYTYDVQVWDASSTDINSFKAAAAETLASANGWAGAGISFAEVPSGGSFTLVLASPGRVAAASPGCSADYSCRSGRYVIINEQRWIGASPSWNAAGGGLRDYRHMVVNHEVGHWLGFGHRSCPGSGRSAPVMLQQSIDLQGCKFNPWPTRAELDSL